MAMTVMLNTYGGHYIIAHTLVLVFWLGAGFGFLAYVKVKVNKVRLFSHTLRLNDSDHSTVNSLRQPLVIQSIAFSPWNSRTTDSLRF